MLKFSANISTLYREYPLLDRIGEAAEAGFDAIEVQFPYEEKPELFRALLDLHQLPLALMNFPVGDLMQGGQGLAAIPGREAEFESALIQAREYAEILRPRSMNVLAGKPGPEHTFENCHDTFCSNLRKAYSVTKDLGIQLVTEPVNTVDLPGFFLSGSQQTIDLIDSLPDIELSMQYDLYHMQMMEFDLLDRLPSVINKTGHIQFSDVPKRTQPGPGCIDFKAAFELIETLGYAGYVGAEYFPTIHTSETLGWLKAYRQG
ncbi:MAG: hydroxypyruvate isomerase [Gammaproteobacteria bacterium]|jgi:hydroxypyruvate isomerase